METLKTIPLTIERVQDLYHINTPDIEFKQYKKRVKEFVKKVEQETMLLLQKHSDEVTLLKHQISSLKKQNQLLKSKSKGSQHQKIQENFDCFSPIKQIRNNFAITRLNLTPHNFSNPFRQSNQSNFISTQLKPATHQNLQFPIQILDPEESEQQISKSRLKIKSLIDQNQQFPIQILDHQGTSAPLVKSRFEMNSKKKKIRQQELIQSIQSGSKNLQHNTVKLFQLLGKVDKPKEEQNQEIQESKESKDKDEELNASLGAICQSLNNSFASKKARSKQRKNVLESQTEMKMKKEVEQERIKREKGVKNLLKSLRECVNSSPKKEIETIKTSKLLNAGGEQNKLSGRTSKVMINPIPVEAERAQQRSPTRSPNQKRAESILKKKTSILSKSIQGISAISFHQSQDR